VNIYYRKYCESYEISVYKFYTSIIYTRNLQRTRNMSQFLKPGKLYFLGEKDLLTGELSKFVKIGLLNGEERDIESRIKRAPNWKSAGNFLIILPSKSRLSLR
jgi:hypothetical protein